MRVVLQRVTRGSVTVDGEIIGSVDQGFVALVGVTHSDTPQDAEFLAQKTANLRVFADEKGKMNRSLLECGGGVLVISQFTLYADTRRGRRPGFTDSAPPDWAGPLVSVYSSALRASGVARVEHGLFGAMMQVEIHNDGPTTIILDTRDYQKEG